MFFFLIFFSSRLEWYIIVFDDVFAFLQNICNFLISGRFLFNQQMELLCVWAHIKMHDTSSSSILLLFVDSLHRWMISMLSMKPTRTAEWWYLDFRVISLLLKKKRQTLIWQRYACEISELHSQYALASKSTEMMRILSLCFLRHLHQGSLGKASNGILPSLS